jgi:hypothetical protein
VKLVSVIKILHLLQFLVLHLEMRHCCSVALKSKISCNWTGRIRKFEILSLLWWSDFRITELFVVSWEKETPAVPDDTVSMVPSCSDLLYWCCLFFFDIQIMNTPFVSSNSSYYHWVDVTAGGQFVREDIMRPVVINCMNWQRSTRILARTSPSIKRSEQDGTMDTVSSGTAKKSLKIRKGYSWSVYRRRTDNTMADRKSSQGQTTTYKTYM